MKQPKSSSDLPLPNINTPKLRTTVDLSVPYEEEVFQFIYGSQLYGTSFAVYANFKHEPNPEGEGVLITQIDYKLINYKGIINLGFWGDNVPYIPAGNASNFMFNVKGLHVNPELSVSYESAVNKKGSDAKPKVILKDKSVVVYNRTLVPQNVFEEAAAGMTGKSQGQTFFDEEFVYRDGYYEAPKEKREGHEGHVIPVPPDTQLMASPRCHQSFVWIRM